jgi:hypothetical protein
VPSWLSATALAMAASTYAHAQDGTPGAAPEALGELPSAEAPPSSCAADRFVILRLDEGFDRELGAEVRTDLTTDLQHRGLGLCDEGATEREPAAIVELSQQAREIVIALDDRVTNKRVARDVSLQGLPANGRALAIAIAIDELLRASWAELALERRHWEGESEPAPVHARSDAPAPVRRRRSPTPPVRHHLGAELVYAHTAANFDAFALRGRLTSRPWQWGWLTLSVGAMATRPVASAYGDALAIGLSSALTLGACTPQAGERVFGCGGFRGGLDWLSVRGVRPSMASARRDRAVITHASVVGQLAATVRGDVYLFGELALGGIVSGATATDGSRTIIGMSGLLLSISVGLGVPL